MPVIHVPYGIKGTHDCDIEARNLVLDADSSFPGEIKGLQGEILKTLDNPVTGPTFSERLSEARKVVVLIDNFARLTPAFKILPPVLKKIRDAGKEVEILVASGLLREMNENELKENSVK